QRQRSIRAGSNGNQASQSTVQRHGQIRFAEEQVTQQQSTDQTTSRRCVSVQEYQSYRMCIADIAEFQHRTTVKAEPAHPQDEGTQSGQRQVSTRNGTDLTVRAVFAFTGTQQNYTRQSRSSARQVNDAGTGEVFEAHIAQIVQTEYRLTAPGPGTFHRIDKGSHHHGEGQECPQLHPLSHRAGYNRHSGCYEYHLEEEVGCTGVDRTTLETVFTGRKFAQHGCCIHFGNTRQEVTAAVHNLI